MLDASVFLHTGCFLFFLSSPFLFSSDELELTLLYSLSLSHFFFYLRCSQLLYCWVLPARQSQVGAFSGVFSPPPTPKLRPRLQLLAWLEAKERKKKCSVAFSFFIVFPVFFCVLFESPYWIEIAVLCLSSSVSHTCGLFFSVVWLTAFFFKCVSFFRCWYGRYKHPLLKLSFAFPLVFFSCFFFYTTVNLHLFFFSSSLYCVQRGLPLSLFFFCVCVYLFSFCCCSALFARIVQRKLSSKNCVDCV